MHAELHIPVVIRGFDPSRNESHMTLCQKSSYVTPNLLINAHFIIPWPPGLCSQGGFDPFLRLKKNQKCFTFEHFGTESVLRFYIGEILQLPGLLGNSGLSDEGRFGQS